MTAIAAAFATAVHFCQSRCQHPGPLCCQLLSPAAASPLPWFCGYFTASLLLQPWMSPAFSGSSLLQCESQLLLCHRCHLLSSTSSDVKSRRGRSLYKRLLLGLMLQCRGQGSTGVCYMATEWAHVRSEQSFRKKWRTGFRSLTALFLLQQSQLPTAGPRKRNVPLWPGYQ